MARVRTAIQILSIVHLAVVAATVTGIAEDEKIEETTSDEYNKHEVESDQVPAGTGHHGQAGVGKDHSRGAKYFMYAHQPDKKQYEFGYKRGNDHHTIERYEKAGPKHDFKTKVRWHDAHGGHGEQYWDYNHVPKHGHHGGHHDDHGHGNHGHGHSGKGHGHGGHPGHGHGHHSEPIPSYIQSKEKPTPLALPSEKDFYQSNVPHSLMSKLVKRSGLQKKRDGTSTKRLQKSNRTKMTKQTEAKKDKEVPSVFPDTLGFNPYVPPPITESKRITLTPQPKLRNPKTTESPRTPMTPQIQSNGHPVKTNQVATKSSPLKKNVPPKLAYDLDTGKVYDEITKSWFKLVPV